MPALVIGAFVRLEIPGSSYQGKIGKVSGLTPQDVIVFLPHLGTDCTFNPSQIRPWVPQNGERVTIGHHPSPPYIGKSYRYLQMIPYDGQNPASYELVDWDSGLPVRVRKIHTVLIPHGFAPEPQNPQEVECVWCGRKSYEPCDVSFCIACRDAHNERLANGGYDIPSEREAVKRFVKHQLQQKKAVAHSMAAAAQSSVVHGKPYRPGTAPQQLSYDPGPWDAEDVDYLV